MKKSFDRNKLKKWSYAKKIILSKEFLLSIFALIIVIYLVIIAKKIIPEINNIIIYNVLAENVYPLSMLVGFTYLILFALMVVYIIELFTEFVKGNKNKDETASNLRIFSMLFVMWIFFTGGMYYIEDQYGIKRTISLALRDDSNAIVGTVNCTTKSGMIFVGDNFTCTSSPKLTDSRLDISFYNKNTLIIKEDKLGNSTFTAPDNVTRISLLIQGMKEDGDYVGYLTGWSHTFLTDDINYTKRKEFPQYIYGLLLLVLVTVPTVFSAIRNVAKK